MPGVITSTGPQSLVRDDAYLGLYPSPLSRRARGFGLTSMSPDFFSTSLGFLMVF